jgi:hypothetical protein
MNLNKAAMLEQMLKELSNRVRLLNEADLMDKLKRRNKNG